MLARRYMTVQYRQFRQDQSKACCRRRCCPSKLLSVYLEDHDGLVNYKEFLRRVHLLACLALESKCLFRATSW